MGEEVDAEPLRAAANAFVAKHGTYRAAAKALGVEHGYLWNLCMGTKYYPNVDIVTKLGLRRVVRYEPLE